MRPVCLVSFNSIQYIERGLLLLVIVASFDVTLKLLVINASSSVSREQQTTPLTSDEYHQLATVWRSICITLGGRTVDITR